MMYCHYEFSFGHPGTALSIVDRCLATKGFMGKLQATSGVWVIIV